MSEIASIVTFGMSDVVQGDKPFGSFSQPKSSGGSAADAAKAEAEAKALLAKQAEDEKTQKKRALLAQPTSGFGPNTNLARSFLTTL